MACTFSTPWRTTLLLASSCWASTALASEPTEPSSVSEPGLEEAALQEAPTEEAPSSPLPVLVHLAEAGDSQGLRTEALKAQAEHPGDPDVDYLVALGTWQVEGDPSLLVEVAGEHAAEPAGEMASLALAEHWLQQSPRLGVRHYQAFNDSHPTSPYRHYASTRAAWGLAHDGYFGMALTQLDNDGVPVPDPLRVTLTTPPEWKRPLLATALSGAVPGLGQLYAGQPAEAASAFLVNALFISGMAYAANQGQWTAFGVAAFFGVGFYMGNIYGAADACLRHNRGLRDEVLDEMDATWPAQPPLPALD